MDEHDNRNADHAGEPAIRDLWLVKVSVSLALLLEVIPLEIEVVHISLVTGNIRYALAAKAIFLTLILLPLFIYVARNRLRTLGVSGDALLSFSLWLWPNWPLICCHGPGCEQLLVAVSCNVLVR